MPLTRASSVIILGAGPSLATSLREIDLDSVRNVEFISVNNFYRDDHFRKLKPSFHIIADPNYWDENNYVEIASPLLDALQSIEWPITLFLPVRAQYSKLHRELERRTLPFAFYRTTPVNGFALLEYFAFSAKLAMPKPQNVLVAAVAVALWMRFKDICIIGADHSWHKELELSPENVLMVRLVHSYGGKTSVDQRPFLNAQGERKAPTKQKLEAHDVFTMREIFQVWATAHESYEKLRKISQRMDVRIVNCSAVTFIDAFERISLADFLAQVNRQ